MVITHTHTCDGIYNIIGIYNEPKRKSKLIWCLLSPLIRSFQPPSRGGVYYGIHNRLDIIVLGSNIKSSPSKVYQIWDYIVSFCESANVRIALGRVWREDVGKLDIWERRNVICYSTKRRPIIAGKRRRGPPKKRYGRIGEQFFQCQRKIILLKGSIILCRRKEKNKTCKVCGLMF